MRESTHMLQILPSTILHYIKVLTLYNVGVFFVKNFNKQKNLSKNHLIMFSLRKGG